MSKKSFKTIVVGLCFMCFASFGIVQPVNAAVWMEKDFSSNSDFGIYESDVIGNELEMLKDEKNEMIYRTVEDGITYEYQEKIRENNVRTKKYEVNNSAKILLEDYETNIISTEYGLLVSTYDNIEQTKEQTVVNLVEDDIVENEHVSFFASCHPWPSGYTGIKASKAAGHSYARNYKTNKGISRLGAGDIIVNIPNKAFDEYTRIVDSLISQENNVVINSLGIGAIDKILKASAKGVSLASLKVILKNTIKVVPGIGAVTTIYGYVNTYHKANVARGKLNGTKTNNGWGCK